MKTPIGLMVEHQPKSILHLDMDAFYPAVEALDNPEFKGKPVIVGGGRERGVVSSASYEARIFGVHSAQPIATAMRLCPNGIFLPVRMNRYKEVSNRIFEIFYEFTPQVEPLSIDEAFLDVSGSERLLGSAVDIAKKIKQRVLDKIGLTVSAGVAPSKFVAKIASDMEKPDGLTFVQPDQVKRFLASLPIKKMWGVGKATQEALTRMNILTFEDLSRTPVQILENKFGKQGRKMHMLSLGIDEREVVTLRQIKSMGHEETYLRDIMDLDTAKKELLALSNKVARRMRQKNTTGKTITLKVKYNNFDQVTRSETLAKSTDDGYEIYNIACCLLKKTDAGKRPVRLLGISLSQLSSVDSQEQLSLFEEDKTSLKRQRLNTALDALVKKHGDDSVRPGALVDHFGARDRGKPL